MHKGCIGSRIVFARLRGAACNLFVIGIYIPHTFLMDHDNPLCATVLAELESVLEKVCPTDCVIVLGDFNSKLPRSYEKLTGKWCIHKHTDVYGGGEALLDVMRRHGLVAASCTARACCSSFFCGLHGCFHCRAVYCWRCWWCLGGCAVCSRLHAL